MRKAPEKSPELMKEIRMKRAQGQRELRQWRKDKGICIRCGKARADYGTLCHDCRERHNTSRRKPKNIAVKGKRPLTDEQKARKRQLAKERRLANKEKGICTRCGKNNPLPGRTLCNACRLYLNQFRSGNPEHTQEWYRKERKEGRI